MKIQTLLFQTVSNLHNWNTSDLLFLGRLSYRNVISSKYSQQGVTLQYCFMELSLVKVLRFNCPKISLLNQKGLHHFSCSNNVTSTSIGKLPIWKFASRYNADIKLFCTIQNNSLVIFFFSVEITTTHLNIKIECDS